MSIQIRWGSVAKLAAGVAAAVGVVSALPSLLAPAEPAQLPPDVGLLPPAPADDRGLVEPASTAPPTPPVGADPKPKRGARGRPGGLNRGSGSGGRGSNQPRAGSRRGRSRRPPRRASQDRRAEAREAGPAGAIAPLYAPAAPLAGGGREFVFER